SSASTATPPTSECRRFPPMNDLNKEIADLRSFVGFLKADRDEAKRKEQSERWTKWVSLSIVFLAVGAALASQQHGGFGGAGVRELNNAAIEQGIATNKWSYYQANSVKLHLYEFEKRRALAEQAAAKTPLGGAALTDVTP